MGIIVSNDFFREHADALAWGSSSSAPTIAFETAEAKGIGAP